MIGYTHSKSELQVAPVCGHDAQCAQLTCPPKVRLGSSPVVLGRDQDRVLAGGRYKGAFAIPVVADTAGMGAEFKMRGDKRRAIGRSWNCSSETHLLASLEFVGDLLEAKGRQPLCEFDREIHTTFQTPPSPRLTRCQFILLMMAMLGFFPFPFRLGSRRLTSTTAATIPQHSARLSQKKMGKKTKVHIDESIFNLPPHSSFSMHPDGALSLGRHLIFLLTAISGDH